MKTPALLENLLKATEPQAWTFIEKKMNRQAVGNGDEKYLYRPGTDVLIVAHVDTVRDEEKPVLLENSKGILRNKAGILGADDRAGVALALEIALEYPNVGILFTAGEEIGGRGVRAFMNEYPNLSQYRLLLELDRKGQREAAFYSVEAENATGDFTDDLGLIAVAGSYTDIATIQQIEPIPGFNLSVGYYDQHTINETLNLTHWLEAGSIARQAIELIAQGVTPYKMDSVKTFHCDFWGYDDVSADDTLENAMEYEAGYLDAIEDMLSGDLEQNPRYQRMMRNGGYHV